MKTVSNQRYNENVLVTSDVEDQYVANEELTTEIEKRELKKQIR